MLDPNLESPPNRTQAPTVAFTLQPIGLVRVAARRSGRLPRYFTAKGKAALEVFHPYAPGLLGLYEGLELWVVTYHAPTGQFLPDSAEGRERLQGVFNSSSVERPNPIGFQRARVVTVDVERGLVQVEGLDLEDGAPILDLRPVTTPQQRLQQRQH